MPLYEANLSSQMNKALDGPAAWEALQKIFKESVHGDVVRGFYHQSTALIVVSKAGGQDELMARYPGIFHSVKPITATVDMN